MSEQRLTDEQILGYAAGELTEEEAHRVEERIKADPKAGQRVARVQRLGRILATDDAVAPPDRVVTQAKALFRTATAPARKHSPWQRWLETIDRLVAGVVYDSRVEPAAAGYRRAESAAIVTRLSFESDLAEIDLQLTRVEKGGQTALQVMGQVSVIAADDAEMGNFPIALMQGGSTVIVAEEQCDEAGAFTMSVPPGTYDLALRVSDRLIVIPDIVIR